MSSFAERIALFAVVMNAKQGPELLEGLADVVRDEACEVLRDVQKCPSSTRQARMSLEFGARADQHERLALLVNEASVGLRSALLAHMTPAQKARFPHLAARKGTGPSPGMDSLAARLVREATR